MFKLIIIHNDNTFLFALLFACVPALEKVWLSRQAFEPLWPSSCYRHKLPLRHCYFQFVHNQLLGLLPLLTRKILILVSQEDLILHQDYFDSWRLHFPLETINNEISRWNITLKLYINALNRMIIKFLPWMFVVGLLICPPPLGEWALSPTLSVSFCVMKSCISSKCSGQYIPSNFVFAEFLDHHLNYFLWYSFSICSYQYRHIDLKSVRAPWEVED